MPRTQIDIHLQVLQADGGTFRITNLFLNENNVFFLSTMNANVLMLPVLLAMRCAAINAVTLALMDAAIPVIDYVCACSAGFLQQTPILGKWKMKHFTHVPYLCQYQY